jgi:hypothetical protein
VKIGYISETATDYANAIRECKTLAHLRLVTEKYRRVADDAYLIALQMTDKDFKEWLAGLAVESKGRFAGDEFALKYGALMMPETLFKVAIVASEYGVPWGCAFIRLKDVGKIKENSGVATVVA